MTHMTETKRPLVPRWCSLEFSGAMQAMGIASASAASGVTRSFALRSDFAGADGKGIEDRAFAKGEDS
jgi:hypothetical protein